MRRILIALLISSVLCAPSAVADELTEMVQKDLVKLGYDPGSISGEMTTDTIVAISKFQSENGMEVTGEPSPQLAGILKAKISQQESGGAGQAASPAVAATVPRERTPAELQAAQQACIQQKIQAQQEADKKKRGFSRLVRAVGRTAGMMGSDLAGDISRTTHDIYSVNATAEDLSAAAEDLGLSEGDLEECRNP